MVAGSWEGAAGFSNIIHDVFIADGMAFLSDITAGQGGLVILDLANLDRPKTVGALAVAEGVHSAWKAGRYVYCNQEFGGGEQLLRVVDVADPKQPRLSGSFRADLPPGAAVLGPHNPFVRDGLLYWAYYDAGVRVFDLAAPAQPVEIAYHTPPLLPGGPRPMTTVWFTSPIAAAAG